MPLGGTVGRVASGRFGSGAVFGDRHSRAVHRRWCRNLLREAQSPLHRGDQTDLGRVYERHHLTRGTGSCRATRTMDVGGILIDGVVVHHALDTVDMDTASRHIGGNQGESLA